MTDRLGAPVVPESMQIAPRARMGYNHRRLDVRRSFLRWVCYRVVFPFTVKVDGISGMENFPRAGPAILMFNHIAFVDPLVVMVQLPRNSVPLAKAELFSNPILGVVPWLYQVIPIRRGEVDRRAVTRALQVLLAGEVILLAPEGTRSPALLPARDGVSFLAARSGAPIIPVAIEGTEGFPSFRRERWRKPGAFVRLGRPFRFRDTPGHPDRETLHKMTSEAMYVLAGMLPPERRGAYADLQLATQDTIETV